MCTVIDWLRLLVLILQVQLCVAVDSSTEASLWSQCAAKSCVNDARCDARLSLLFRTGTGQLRVQSCFNNTPSHHSLRLVVRRGVSGHGNATVGGMARHIQIIWSFSLVGRRGVMLAKIIRLVGCARFPVDGELSLVNSVFEPVEPHVDGFGASLFDGVVEDPLSTLVVGDDGCSWLGMA